MNADQLISARAARWSQNGEARLTLESAREWLDSIGFCLYLPGSPSAAPMASFVEAVVGRPAPVPSAGERSRASSLLARIVAGSGAVPLRLGAAGGEQPDFLATPQTLRYVYAMRGNRNFKNGPATGGNEKTTTLALHCWQAMQQHGPLHLAALQQHLGQDITEAALLRALHELWTTLYVIPIPGASGEPATWDLLFRRFPQPVAAGTVTAHAEALSALISLYLQAMVAAAEEEIVTFLSPFAPQSRLREIIRGLGSMRQLDIIDIGGRSHVCLQGGLLPEEVQAPPVPEQQETPEFTVERVEDAPVAPSREPRPAPAERYAASPGPRPRPDKFAAGKFSPKKFGAGTSAPRKSFAGRSFAASAERPPRRFDGKPSSRAPFAPRPKFEKGSPTQRPGRFPQKPSAPWSKPGKRAGADDSSSATGTPRSTASGAPAWKSKDSSPRNGGFSARPQKPWQQRSFQRPGKPGGEDAAAPERTFRQGAGAPRSGSKPGPKFGAKAGSKFGPKFGSKPGAKPWAKKSGPRSSEGSSSFGARPWKAKAPGSPDGPKDGPKFRQKFGSKPGAKPWAKKSGSSRDSWKTPQRADTPGSRRPFPQEGEPTSDRPSRPSRFESGAKPRRTVSTAKPGAKPRSAGAKPFWTKNPRTVKKTMKQSGGKGGAGRGGSGIGKPGMGKPGMGKPGMGKPGKGKSGKGRPQS